MSRYHFIAILLAFLSVSCAQKNDPIEPSEYKTIQQKSTSEADKTDAYLLIAFDASNRQDYGQASYFFEKLYDATKDKKYIVEAIKNAIILKDYQHIQDMLEKAKDQFGDDKFINRYMLANHIDKKEYKKANILVTKLLQNEPNEQDYELAALSAKAQGNFTQAQKYYKKAYSIKHSPKPLLGLSSLYLQQNQMDQAIRLLETHTRIYGCQKEICHQLIKIYTNTQDLDALADIYIKVYNQTQDPIYANALLEIYAYQQNYDKAIAFLKKTHFNDDMLLDIYTAKKDYKHAKQLAHKRYIQTNDLKFLAKEAVLKYESTKNKNSAFLKKIFAMFEKSVYHLQNPLYYNYYAYLLIDHDVDVKKGIALVKKALEIDNDSLFYIDTLAWGYYKQHRCKEAYKLLKPFEADAQQKEIIEHIDKIKKCLKDKQ